MQFVVIAKPVESKNIQPAHRMTDMVFFTTQLSQCLQDKPLSRVCNKSVE